jgi:hypothetical protein
VPADAGLLLLAKFVFSWPLPQSCNTLATSVCSFNARVIKGPFKLAGGFLVAGVVVGIRYGVAGRNINPGPNDVDVIPA